ncbi:putative N-acyl-D-glucosamine 2-epimerase [Vibrio nigripulchritudo SFn27]|uniref:Putative N-acyl-D-glucosamine 2-epimerase n=1 Tax=Vibrio nigripulchritudo TaxID=28173 RepID=U4K7J1_9VIBR|nr:AGE family epimerase/isomerase [Vibrio nigripulchritudo]CCN81979.1 putative N-acyl-D-glucosamine 2-epimerase [Vibrio nigripulchritudo BLFn1]CCN90442.1 putative N-acyl-D-glucosamine 2-epimerase [Vibrio nigripulchritudo SFn27]CCN93784.1 putative N-acyl-D-glucosamine 2-epimerase [Vibrio nigripulchritudo ENn2]CCO42812.1 putative N-acyl-D-glucosamine 2-epimerase [Vibrio nigripulchritudo SFn135]CCO55600.1 putative N-acyl-D-glucosamine 2-epimerase [Vibrio nigripulchritudo Wn13]
MESIEFQAARCRRWLEQHALPLWLGKGFDEKNGLFVEGLLTPGQTYFEPGIRFRVQPRQVYVYCHATKLGMIDGLPQIESAVTRGFPKFESENGGYFFSINNKRDPHSMETEAYDIAFALLGYAWHFNLTNSQQSKHQLESIFEWLEQHLSDKQNGGYFSSDTNRVLRSQNPHMHLFETTLVCYQFTQDQRWLSRAKNLYHLFKSKFLGTNCLQEFFDSQLNPKHEKSERIDPGHHYEWIWLLNQYRNMTGEDTRKEIHTLQQFVNLHGHNENGLVRDEVLIDGETLRSTSRLWCQTEYLKAQIALWETDKLNTYRVGISEAVNNIFKFYLDEAEHGLWIDQVDENGLPIHYKSPASTFYHLFLAFSELIRVASEPHSNSLEIHTESCTS